MPENGEWEPKIWGEVNHLFHCNQVAVSHLKVKKGYCCSRHFHQDRENIFLVKSGIIAVEEWRGDDHEIHHLDSGKVHIVPPKILHRFIVIEDGVVIEVYWTKNNKAVRLDDIIRLDEGGKYKDNPL